MRDGDHSEGDVALQPGGIDGRGNLADGLTRMVDRPKPRVGPFDRVACDDDPHLRALHARGLDARQCCLSDEIGLHFQIDQTVQPKLIGVGLDVGIRMIREHATLDPADRRGVPGLQPEFHPCRHDPFPQHVAIAAVAQIDFVAKLT